MHSVFVSTKTLDHCVVELNSLSKGGSSCPQTSSYFVASTSLHELNGQCMYLLHTVLSRFSTCTDEDNLV